MLSVVFVFFKLHYNMSTDIAFSSSVISNSQIRQIRTHNPNAMLEIGINREDKQFMTTSDTLFKKHLRKKRQVHTPIAQNEDDYTKILDKNPLTDNFFLQKALNITSYKKRDINFAAAFHNLLQILLPGLSRLNVDKIYNANDDDIKEINRLRSMILIKANIILLHKAYNQAKNALYEFEWQIKHNPYKYSVRQTRFHDNLKKKYNAINDEMLSQRAVFVKLLTEQNSYYLATYPDFIDDVV